MKATVPFVEEKFRQFNESYFGGELPPIPIVLSRARTFLGKLEYKGKRGIFGAVVSYYDFRMKISYNFDLPENELEDVIIHEMIHYYIVLNRIKDTSTHGKVFKGIMHTLNSQYGRHITVRYHSPANR